jgi:acyl-CoA reductase-like NAD-dependent aldehyde dehydrogenase
MLPAPLVDVAGVAVSPDHFIGGQRVPSPDTFEVRSPLEWSWQLADVARGDASTAHAAVTAAQLAFRPWADLGPEGRAVHLHRLADLIVAATDDISLVECVDAAMLQASLREGLVASAAEHVRHVADLAVATEAREWSADGTRHTIARVPAGPVVVITSWRAPFLLATAQVVPALAAGNPVILKPAAWTPLSCSLLADLTAAADFPPGVFNLVQGVGQEVGAALSADHRVKRISVMGSPETVRHVARAAADNLVPFRARLGGKRALLVFADADLDAAATHAAAQYAAAGQVGVAGTRLLVEATARDEFLARFDAAMDRHVLGDSRDPATTIGPLIHPDHVTRVEALLARAREHGDHVLRGGGRVGSSLHVAPTLVEPASNDSEVVQHERTGPALTFQTFADETHAVELANSTRDGVAATVHTSSEARAQRIGRAIRGGVVEVNPLLASDRLLPLGGIERERAVDALDFHSDRKTVEIREGTTS